MPYQCQDCSHQSPAISSGYCPACGSANIKNTKSSQENQKNSKRRSYRLLFCVVLWGYLAVAIYQKLSS
jgi:predicted RNA-binding Zn-ribbon protein involved in translation (DUF1610 family)